MWNCEPSVDGERGSFTAATKREAEFLAAEWARDKKKRRLKGLTLGAAAERYIEARSAVLSPKTIKENKGIFRKLPPEILNIDLSKIDDELIQIWVNEKSAQRAPKTVRNHYGFVAAVIHCYAPDHRLETILPQPESVGIYVPTHGDVQHLLSVLDGKDHDLYISTLVASNVGLRRGEISALNNKPENFKKRKIDVHQAFVDDENNNIVLKTTKTYKSNRILIAPQYVAERLLETPNDWKYVVKLLPHNITQRFETVVRREFDHEFTFHDLRHYYASVLLAQNVPERYAMKLLGHSTPDMLRRVYGHIMADKEDEVVANVNTFFENSHKNAHENAHIDTNILHFNAI